MEQTKELAMPEESTQSMTVAGVHRQIQLIQEVMRTEMQDGEHFGTVPGCGDKKVLLKSGAEKLSLLFKMAPRFKVETVDMGNGHREVRIITELYHIESGKFLGEGVGSCSTLESKYRYRNSQGEPTGELVPKEYWKGRDPELIGGRQFIAQKIDGRWLICLKGERVENPDIADTYNTVLKMGKKRSQVDAVLTVTAASDLFTQDLEETASDTRSAQESVKDPISEPQKAVSTFEPTGDELAQESDMPEFGDAPEEVMASPVRAQAAATPKNVPHGTMAPQIPKERIMAGRFDAPCFACKKIMKNGANIYKGEDGRFRHMEGPNGVPCR